MTRETKEFEKLLATTDDGRRLINAALGSKWIKGRSRSDILDLAEQIRDLINPVMYSTKYSDHYYQDGRYGEDDKSRVRRAVNPDFSGILAGMIQFDLDQVDYAAVAEAILGAVRDDRIKASPEAFCSRDRCFYMSQDGRIRFRKSIPDVVTEETEVYTGWLVGDGMSLYITVAEEQEHDARAGAFKDACPGIYSISEDVENRFVDSFSKVLERDLSGETMLIEHHGEYSGHDDGSSHGYSAIAVLIRSMLASAMDQIDFRYAAKAYRDRYLDQICDGLGVDKNPYTDWKHHGD